MNCDLSQFNCDKDPFIEKMTQNNPTQTVRSIIAATSTAQIALTHMRLKGG